jgi:hypothetical protein
VNALLAAAVACTMVHPAGGAGFVLFGVEVD